jgi:hypothetical protein
MREHYTNFFVCQRNSSYVWTLRGDVVFSADESEHLLVRADMLVQLQKAVAARELAQLQRGDAAEA